MYILNHNFTPLVGAIMSVGRDNVAAVQGLSVNVPSAGRLTQQL